MRGERLLSLDKCCVAIWISGCGEINMNGDTKCVLSRSLSLSLSLSRVVALSATLPGPGRRRAGGTWTDGCQSPPGGRTTGGRKEGRKGDAQTAGKIVTFSPSHFLATPPPLPAYSMCTCILASGGPSAPRIHEARLRD